MVVTRTEVEMSEQAILGGDWAARIGLSRVASMDVTVVSRSGHGD